MARNYVTFKYECYAERVLTLSNGKQRNVLSSENVLNASPVQVCADLELFA